ncbi:MAG: hypothetical protein SFY95_10410 [Planctomycetota bacterium]|nr:hypothetical protein [Planctomycetota bacterium]
MNKLLGLALAAGVCASAHAQYTTLDFSSQFNISRSGALIANGPTYPFGAQTFAGVPFAMGGTANAGDLWAWGALLNQDSSVAGGTRTLEIDVNVFGVREAYTLINTHWGQSGPNSYLSVTFIGDSTTEEFQLVGNTNIRDYNQFNWTNQINNTTTVEVWNNGRGQRLDMQTFALDEGFATQTLRKIRIVDTGAWDFQRAIVAGATVFVPSPGAAALLGLAGLTAMRRRR